MSASLVVLIASEGAIGRGGAGVGLVGAGLILAGAFWFIAKRGVLRWVGLALWIHSSILVLRNA